MQKLREEFSVFKNEDGDYFRFQNLEKKLEEVKLAVHKPNHKQQSEADFIYAKYMNKYLSQGIDTTDGLERTIHANGIWNQDKIDKENDLAKRINDATSKLSKGRMKVSEGVKIAKDGIKARGEWLMLTAEKNNKLNNSADALARNHRFNYLAAVCSVNAEDDAPLFKDYDDFLKRDGSGEFVPTRCGEAFAKLMYNMDEDFRKDWPEYKFLLKFKKVNEKLEFLNSEGEVVDINGEKIVAREVIEEKVEEPEFYDDESVDKVKAEEETALAVVEKV
jgi:hypothetical protein